MRTFETYIQRELLKPFFVILLIFASLYAAFSSARLLAEAVTESLGAMAMAKLVGLKTVIALEVLLPASLYIAVIAGLGRLYRDQELLVLQAAGVNPMRIVYAVMMLAIPVGLASAILSISVRPAAYAESYLLDLQAEAELNTDRFQAGRFYGNDDTGSVVYIQDRHRQSREMQDEFAEQLFRTTPEKAASEILRAVKQDARRVLVGSDARAADAMQRLMPTLYQRLVTFAVRRSGKGKASTEKKVAS